MTRRFEASTFIETSPEAVFDWISDHRNVPRVLDGVSRWEPLTRKTTGEGARFDVAMKTLGVPLTAELELDEWRRPNRIAWRSLGGLISQRGVWDIAAADGGTRVSLSIDYEPPAAALGNLLAGPVEHLARSRLQAALDRLAEYVVEESA